MRLALDRVWIVRAQPIPKPQPDPWRVAFLAALAQAVIKRAALMQEIIDTLPRAAGQSAASAGYVARFTDDYCGNGFRPRYPFPGPPPHWFDGEINALDLLVLATEFERAARAAGSPALGQTLAAASGKLADTGIAKMQ